MSELYIGFVDTPGLFASLIRHVLKQKYVHVVIGLDPGLEEAYSIGRRNPFIPFLAGFEKENRNKILKKYPGADYEIRKLTCTIEEKNQIRNQLRFDYTRRRQIHYMVIGLLFVLFQKPYFHKNYYTCSSYVADILDHTGIMKWSKECSCITPKDFYDRTDMECIFHGSLKELIEKEQTWIEKKEGFQFLYSA